jgi:hypothetical protein
MRCRKAFGSPKSKLARTKFLIVTRLPKQRLLAGTDDALADAPRSLAFSKCYDPAAVAAR